MQKWTYEKCLEESKKYKSRSEFSKNNKTAYNASIRNKWINDFVWLKRPENKKKKWTEETVLEEAKKYKSINEFRKSNKRAYNLSCENGWIKKYDFLKRRSDEPTYEECLNEAKKFDRRYVFALKDRKYYDISKKYGWLEQMNWLTPRIHDYVNGKEDLVYGYFFNDLNAVYIGRTIDVKSRDYQHRTQENDSVYKFSKENNVEIPQMIIIEDNLTLKEGQKREGFWVNFYKKQGKNIINIAKTGSIGGLYGIIFTKKKCFVLAKECKSKTEFMKKYPTAYTKSLKYGWIDQYEWFKRPISYNLKWTYDATLREAKKYNTGGEFRIKNKGAYKAAVRNGWLKDYGWMRIKNTKVKNMIVEFYKENLDFPLSGGDTFSNNNRKSIRRILNALKNYIGKKTNVKVNINDKHKILISNLINFCKLEGIDYNQILEIEVIQNGETFQIIVNKGTNENVQILEID